MVVKLTAPLPIKFVQCCVSLRYTDNLPREAPGQVVTDGVSIPQWSLYQPTQSEKGVVAPCTTAVQFPPNQKEHGLFFAQQYIPSQERGPPLASHGSTGLRQQLCRCFLSLSSMLAPHTCPFLQSFLPPYARQVAHQPAGPRWGRASMKKAFASSQGFKRIKKCF